MNQICIKCKKEKALKNFSKKSSNTNGYNKTCMLCVRERQRERKKEKEEWWDAYTIPKW